MQPVKRTNGLKEYSLDIIFLKIVDRIAKAGESDFRPRQTVSANQSTLACNHSDLDSGDNISISSRAAQLRSILWRENSLEDISVRAYNGTSAIDPIHKRLAEGGLYVNYGLQRQRQWCLRQAQKFQRRSPTAGTASCLLYTIGTHILCH